MAKTLLKIENIVKKFGSIAAVDDVSLDIIDGEFLALLGPSGCGKTTLLRMLGGFEAPSSGRVLIDQQDITHYPPNKRPLNMLFQSYAVFPHMTVRDNVGYGLRFLSISDKDARQRVDDVLALVRMSDYANRKPNQLSGGQRQRVGLARCLVLRPKILLLDEPLSALDAKLRESMQIELVNLQKMMGITFIVVTHDQDEALSMATRIAVMDHGKICQVATPKAMYEAPNSRFVANFIGRMNLIRCTATPTDSGLHIKTDDFEASLSNNEHSFTKPCSTDIGIRPVNLSFASDSDDTQISIPVTVKNRAYYGGETLLQCEATSKQILLSTHANRHRGEELEVLGDSGYLHCHAKDIIVFDKEDTNT